MARPSRIIGIEEHFEVPGAPSYGDTIEPALPVLTDFEVRLADMDRHGIDFQVLSHAGPGVQFEPDLNKAVTDARRLNDKLGDIVRKYPTRFSGFAHLPWQAPKQAADELERSVRELNLKGAMVKNHVLDEYLDADKFLPVWERAEALDVPIYLHPAPPPHQPDVMRGYPGLGTAMWGWTAETGGHALRLVLAGLFDRFPKLKLILGHMGEALPFHLWRLDSRFLRRPPKIKLAKLPSHYVRDNILVTTSGVFSDEPLLCTIAAMGIDSVIFSIDYPHEETKAGIDWIPNAPLGQAEIEKIAHGNVTRILRL